VSFSNSATNRWAPSVESRRPSTWRVVRPMKSTFRICLSQAITGKLPKPYLPPGCRARSTPLPDHGAEPTPRCPKDLGHGDDAPLSREKSATNRSKGKVECRPMGWVDRLHGS